MVTQVTLTEQFILILRLDRRLKIFDGIKSFSEFNPKSQIPRNSRNPTPKGLSDGRYVGGGGGILSLRAEEITSGHSFAFLARKKTFLGFRSLVGNLCPKAETALVGRRRRRQRHQLSVF